MREKRKRERGGGERESKKRGKREEKERKRGGGWLWGGQRLLFPQTKSSVTQYSQKQWTNTALSCEF